MIEQAVTLPADHTIIGVVTEPPSAAHERLGCLLLNAGMLHRIGPNRVYVRMARALAARGVTTLRFDLSGVGDSAPRRDGESFRAGAVRDVTAAMDYLGASHDVRGGFILAGVCSGADLAFRVALADSHVVGLVLVDGLPYRTRRAAVHAAVRRVMRRDGWKQALAPRRLARVLRRGVASTPAPAGLGQRDVPPLREAEQGLKTLTERGVRILAVYTEGREYAYRRQFADCFPSVRRDRVRVVYLQGTDHTFTLLANQDRLVRTVEEWIEAWR